MSFGKRLKFVREQRGLSQAALAQAVGGTTADIAQWEAWPSAPAGFLEDLRRLGHVLGVYPGRLDWGDLPGDKPQFPRATACPAP